MRTRRTALGMVAGAWGMAIIGRAHASSGQRGQASDGGELRNRGAPTGRTGAATRGDRIAGSDMTVQMVAPLRGVGLASVNQPNLYYLMQGRSERPFRLTISAAGQARPLADFNVHPIQTGGLGMISLRERRVRLVSNLLCVWSLALPLNPGAPSEDLVSSALIEYRPGLTPPGRNQSLERRVAETARAGYWYDAVELAERGRESDGGEALASLLGAEELRLPAEAGRRR